MTSMPESIITRFEVISTMLYQIQQLPEWEQYCKESNLGLTPKDYNYAVNKRNFSLLENTVISLLSKEQNFVETEQTEAIEKAIEAAVMFFIANGKFPDFVD